MSSIETPESVVGDLPKREPVRDPDPRVLFNVDPERYFREMEARICEHITGRAALILERIEKIEEEARAQVEMFSSPDGMMKMAEQFLGGPPPRPGS